MPENILLIDGMYLVFSSFYSYHAMRTLKGEPTGALFGFISRVESLIQELQPNRLVVAFDSKEKNFRRDLYPEYKAKRLLPPEELIQQLPAIREYLTCRGIHFLEKPGLEADDIIALLARRFAADGSEVLIFSADKDLFQLVAERIFIFHPKLKRKLDRGDVKEFFGVYPEQIVDYLALAGDASDNIPGIPGIGDKTATKLIEKFGSLAAMLAGLDQVEVKLQEKIRANIHLFELWYRLLDFSKIPAVDLDLQVPPFVARADERLLELYRRFQFNSLLKKMDAAPRAANAEPAIAARLVENPAQLKELAGKIKAAGSFAWDIETTAIEFFKAGLVGLSVFVDGGGYYVPFLVPSAAAARFRLTIADFHKEMAGLFHDAKIKKTGHNLKFDMLHLLREGMPAGGIEHDTMIMSYLLFPNRRTHQLKELSAEFLGVRQTTYDELVGKGKSRVKITEVDVEQVGSYCVADSRNSWQLVEKLLPQLRDKQLLDLYREIEMPLLHVLLNMEWHGIAIDRAFLKKAATRLQEQIASTEKEVQELAGYEFNLNSSQQLAELLFEKMNLPLNKKTRKTKVQSTDIDVLNELKGFPIVEKLIAYRTYKKLHSTYVQGLLDNHDENDRVHTSFNQTVTATGRLSSSNPNLQNIPVGEIAGLNLRRAFVAAKDKLLLSADYSQIELRVMAHFSGDKNLLQAFTEGMDIHQHTADLVFAADLFSPRGELRRRAKIINFSIIYGSGAYSLARELGVSFAEAKAFIDRYFEKYSGVRLFMDKVIAAAEKDPEVRTISGRVRPIPEILSSNRTVKENGNRMAINTIIQGSAADIIKIAMIRIHGHLRSMQSRLILQVHDELVFEYPAAEEKRLLTMVKSEMENALPLQVPLQISLKKGLNWADMEEIKG
ncbi:MAG: DNA polymerase I [Acidobacteria bacterium]|nr:DNA polymerase I [Acidobacteriota bacterium]MBU4306450.1 DNA polymerase I [Acidobacteriota bacterium]MBU4404173.1 DNA polymerase I [Acidobacteriota bacterium]MCG2812465.1 DNA polymerase I [Candidatus Aminicenantes bacterium]